MEESLGVVVGGRASGFECVGLFVVSVFAGFTSTELSVDSLSWC